MKRPDLRIRVQLTVSVCLFTLVCLVSLAVAINTLSRNTLLNLERGNLDLNSRMLREECSQELEDVYDSFSRLSYSSPVQQIFRNNTNPETILDAANLLHDSFGPDRILLMTLHFPNGTEILEVDSRAFQNRSGVPHSLMPLSYAGSNIENVLNRLEQGTGEFIGPLKAAKPISGTKYLMSLTLPIRSDETRKYTDLSNKTNNTIGFATFLINCLRLQRILSSVSLSSAVSEVGSAALCAAVNNLTEFQQLIPFNDNTTALSTDQMYRSYQKFRADMQYHQMTKRHTNINEDGNFPIPKVMAKSLRNDFQPTAEVNKGPEKSMISISQFGILDSVFYVVVLQSHKGVFSMTHHLRNIIILTSCVIGAGMIIFTFLFVSFGARQILRLKMAATYEQPAPSKWKVLPLPWWLRPVNRKSEVSSISKSEFRVPEKVPLRKHVRDELDDITERFNIMSNELRKQYALLEDRVEVRKAEIEQAREAADIANAAKSHFLARVTHELRTPLNGIIGTATLCLEEDNIQQIHQSLRTIFKCGELLLHLMTDLLSFSQNEVENLDLEYREFSLSEITSQLTAIFTEQCANKDIRLVVDSDPANNKYILCGDTNRILQVIFNLMSNGIKFTPEGGEVNFKAEVNDSAKPDEKELSFFVKDNGPGIAPEMQARVFEAFVQGDISLNVKKAGVGLGLSICHQLAARMNGTVTLESELGKGSQFIFKIPLKFRLYDFESGNNSNSDLLDTSTASIMRKSPSNGQTASTPLNTPLNTPLGTPLEETPPLPKEDSPSRTPEGHEKSSGSIKSSTARSVLTRTLSSTSSRTKGFFGGRRKTQDSVFRPMDLLNRRASSETVPLRSNESDNSASRSTARLPTAPECTNGSRHASTSGSPALSEEDQTPSSSGYISEGSGQPPELGCLSARLVTTPAQPQSRAHELEQGLDTKNTTASSPNTTNNTQNLPNLHIPKAECSLDKRDMSNRKPSNEQLSPFIKVLVVDDNSVNQEVMMRMLNLEGLKSIIVANDGVDAIEKIKQADANKSSFDVIFMDVQMPNMDGRQATRIIRNEMKKNVPVVAVSAFANEKNAEDCIEAGMNLFLSKPLRRPHLREILRSLASISGPLEDQ